MARGVSQDTVRSWVEPDYGEAALQEHFCRADGVSAQYVLGNLYFRFLGPAFPYGAIDPRNEHTSTTADEAVRHLRELRDYTMLDVFTERQCRVVVELVVKGLSPVPVHRRLREFRNCIGQRLISAARHGKTAATPPGQDQVYESGSAAGQQANRTMDESQEGQYVLSAAAKALEGSLWNTTWPHGAAGGAKMANWWMGTGRKRWDGFGRDVLLASEMLASEFALQGGAHNTSVACRELESDAGLPLLLQNLALRRRRSPPARGAVREPGARCEVHEWWWCRGAAAHEVAAWAGDAEEPVNLTSLRSVVVMRHDAIVYLMKDRALEHVANAYRWLLGRDPDPSGLEGYYDLLRRTGGCYKDVREVLVKSSEYMRRCAGGACHRAREAVRALFVKILLREPGMHAKRAR